MCNNDGYLFAYFGHEGSPDGEQVHFAVSSSDAPLVFTPLNNGTPVLRSNLGEGGVRDPFLVRNELTGGFHLLATDLSLHRVDDWDRAVRHGSRGIVIWDSQDLLRWDSPRLEILSPPDAGCTWAPEAILDRTLGQYVVVWSSAIYGPGDTQRKEDSHMRVLYSTTRDFRTFSSPQTYLDPGHSVIDTTFLEYEGIIHRFTKDERSRSGNTPSGKHIFQESTRNGVLADDFSFVAEGIGDQYLEQGEGPIAVPSLDGRSCYLLIDEFSRNGYVAFETDDPTSGDWKPASGVQLPAGARHGSLLAINAQERRQLMGIA